MTNILDTLKTEHDQLRELFAQINKTADSEADARHDLLKRIEALLIPHSKWEETVFYPAFEDRADHEQQLIYAEAIQEHRAVELAVLPDIHAADVDSRQFAGSVQVCGEMVKHHAHEEETKMFDTARELFSAAELADFDREYARWKDSSGADAITSYAKVKTAAMAFMRNPESPA
ncbi:MAG TPA: hemerythrin domain-containing protein [Frateuria sp.]|uniref:hemerythrin domain-containing protein n=1 Tax=Frateuria sp. TaxID=2211372 RepID=UPI002DEEED91|nr:hemerythrin domain-containing protein [Frateuria sp.]